MNLQLQVGPAQTFNDTDCFYYPQNQVPALDLTTILNLDPFLDTDPAFDPSDIVGGALSALQRDNRTWAYPLVIEPAVLWYNTPLFAESGFPSPEGGWTVDEFDAALRQLRTVAVALPFFVPPAFGNTTC